MAIDKNNINQSEFAQLILDDLSEELQAKLNVKEIYAIQQSVEKVIIATVEDGKEIYLHGFGKWLVSERAARTGRNPKTGEAIQIPAKKYLKFKTAKKVNEGLNQ